jgi:dephospho-CoA kinase
LRFRDWLRADAGERAAYATMKTELATGLASTEDYAVAKEPWFDAADERARAWAESSGWSPSRG